MDLAGDRVIARPCGAGPAMASSGGWSDRRAFGVGDARPATRRALLATGGFAMDSIPRNHGRAARESWSKGDAQRRSQTSRQKRRLEAWRDLVMRPQERFLRFLDNRRQTFLFVSLFLILIGARAVVINY